MEKEYEQKVKNRILALGMSYQDKDGAVHCTTTTSDYNFIFTGPLDDDKKWEAYGRADLFVLPTYSENFGIVVAEALWAGVPVITTKGTPWAELECSASSKFKVQSSKLEERCGWWIDLPEKGADPADWKALQKALGEAMTAKDLKDLGKRGHELVEKKYTWPAVVKAVVEGYEKIRG